ncbi:MAG: hypothetical protein GX896_08150 [Clostridiales bacterium]|nr:hypothetical protein [Clostridiales bacterium]
MKKANNDGTKIYVPKVPKKADNLLLNPIETAMEIAAAERDNTIVYNKSSNQLKN